MSAEIRWEDPPPKSRWRDDRYAEVYAALRQNPGRWALLSEHAGSQKAAAAAGWERRRRGPGFEVIARGTKVYARFLGDTAQEPPASHETADQEGGAHADWTLRAPPPEAPVVSAARAVKAPPPEPRAPAVSEEERRLIGSRVRAARKARRMTQEAVGRELQTSGALVSLLEGGQKVSAPVLARAAAWIEAPHERDNLPAKEHGKNLPPHAARQVARKMSPVMRSKKSLPPATDWRPSAPATPMALPKGMELHLCPALRARITEKACAANKARAKGDIVLQDHCPGCPGVAALAKRGGAAA